MNAVASQKQTKSGQIWVKDFAFDSIQKSFHQSIKHEADVFTDEDVEAVHQMRVGMRKLRTVLAVFAPFVSLPPHLSSDLKTLSKSLGSVRDLDVLAIWFGEYKTRTVLSPEEIEQFSTLLQQLQRQRRKRFKQMGTTLSGKHYRRFLEEMQRWLKDPIFLPSAEWPLQVVLPDITLPLVSQLLTHPGWLAGSPSGAVSWPVEDSDINASLTEHGAVLHDLRKQMKRVRYQTECFTDFYGKAYSQQIQDFKAIQDLLGELQDSQVLSHFLREEIGKDWTDRIPSLERYLSQQRLELWQQWQPIRQKYLTPSFRNALRSLVEDPLWPEAVS